MTISPDHIRTVLAGYADEHPEDKDSLAPVFAALDRDDDPTSRRTSPVHVTAGAVLVNEAGSVLLVHHNATGKWLTPGGHLEPEDTSSCVPPCGNSPRKPAWRAGSFPFRRCLFTWTCTTSPRTPRRGARAPARGLPVRLPCGP